GGLGGDKVSEHVVRTAAKHLKEGGFAIILVDWYHQGDDDWATRPGEWLDGAGCDVWWQRFEQSSPLTYASRWLTATSDEEAELTRRCAAWVQFYKDLRATGLNHGAVVLRKRSNAINWERFEDLSLHEGSLRREDVGNQIETVFASEDMQEEISDDAA